MIPPIVYVAFFAGLLVGVGGTIAFILFTTP